MVNAKIRNKNEKEKLRYETHICPMCKYKWDTLIIDDFVVINYKNDTLEYREREKYFNESITNIRNYLYEKMNLDKHKKFEKNKDNNGYIPILSFNPHKKTYRFNCYCFDCPCNSDGLCSSEHIVFPVDIMHPFDGDNIVKQFCG